MIELPQNEEARLGALASYDVLDTLPERAFDDLALLASLICGTPISAVTLVDRDRQWFKSRIGLGVEETAREQSFCSRAILSPHEVMVVPDATQDARFVDNALVRGEMGLRFYAGAPLVTSGGEALGALCVLDTKPRELSEVQKQALQALARQTMAQLELKRQCMQLVNDLAWRIQMESSLRESEGRFRAFMDNSPLVASLKDQNGCYVYVNQTFLNRFSFEREQVIGRDYSALWPGMASHFLEQDRRVIEDGEVTQAIETVTLPDGSQQFWQAYRFLVQRGGGSSRYVAAVALDVTENKRYEQQLEAYQDQLQEALSRVQEQSLRDPITGLYNRRSFDRKMQEEFDGAQRYGSQLSALVLDVDRFKEFNDAFGLATADEMLADLARVLQDTARGGDFVARYGGDEFAVILPNTGRQGAFVMADRFRRAVQEGSWPKRPVTVCVGVASLAPSLPSAGALLKAAEDALCRAKAGGRSKVVQDALVV